MKLTLDRRAVFAGTGGYAHDAAQPLAVLLHGAGMDHTIWALQSRALARRGLRVVAVDLPGHGASEGPPLGSIEELADWTAALIRAAGAGRALIAGHSMGSLIALETAARHPERVAGLALIGTAAAMPVHADLLAAAAANDDAAIAMVSLWGLGATATLGGGPAPGLWMLGGARRLLERAGPGVLHADLAACAAYANGAEAAAALRCPATLILGGRDQMTPLKAGQALAGLIADAHIVALEGAGHLLTIERPDDVLAALTRAASCLNVGSGQTSG
ncbi:Pimeloyl-ACP methyl ester carboxylesterase [Rhodoblastus acidophilus]|uniref:Pimeloyl-ACP methyl ester carboxylesterase n=3 Tax=Rhodoblastus acidophilus TaxID=1074 RepID=A0A212PYH3_RHOAC|nr:alpha/beta hydrolase [Rhodoblastus acidophilus]PPQ38717.1 alpha/beta hydrolase [Rhodoblastus acidophilus]SNB52161.1 Pimeloyl-ACP methyl ester carboxylesterase [Rhodoblastus acidophilus]